MTIESLKNYVDNISKLELIDLSKKIYVITDSLCAEYPKYKKWFFTKQLPETLNSNERNILFVRNPKNEKDIIAMACLKKDLDEQKICTLFVSKEYRGIGIGKKLIEESINWLGTTKPFITIADYKLEMFGALIEKYDWKLTEIVSGIYNDKFCELCFNGMLTKSNKEILEEQLKNKLLILLNKIKNNKMY